MVACTVVAMRYLLSLTAALLLCPAAAQARTIQQDLAVAESYWQTTICRGEWKVLPGAPTQMVKVDRATHPDPTLMNRDALAHTFMTDCTIYLRPGLAACDREGALLHEVGHFIHGAHHTGPMAHRVLDDLPCVGEREKSKRVKARWMRQRSAKAKRWWRAAL